MALGIRAWRVEALVQQGRRALRPRRIAQPPPSDHRPILSLSVWAEYGLRAHQSRAPSRACPSIRTHSVGACVRGRAAPAEPPNEPPLAPMLRAMCPPPDITSRLLALSNKRLQLADAVLCVCEEMRLHLRGRGDGGEYVRG
jgi:hypothetical protein